jgi:cytochrome c556
MLRKLAVLSVTLVTVAGLAFAAPDDETETRKIMEKINKHHNDIRKATRNAPDYKKSGGKIPEYAQQLIAEAKKARELKESAETAKKPFSEWQKLMDDMIKSTEQLSKIAAKTGSTQAQAKEAYNTYNKTCTACHDVFKKDE